MWVGPQFFEGLRTSIKGVALQDVDSDDYPADLNDYLEESGGSDAGAASMAKAIEDYTSQCPDSTIIISGWRYIYPILCAYHQLKLLQPRRSRSP